MMQDVEERRIPLQNSMDELAKKLTILQVPFGGMELLSHA